MNPDLIALKISHHAREIYDAPSGHVVCRAPIADGFPSVIWADNARLIVALPALIDALRALADITPDDRAEGQAARALLREIDLAAQTAGR